MCLNQWLLLACIVALSLAQYIHDTQRTSLVYERVLTSTVKPGVIKRNESIVSDQEIVFVLLISEQNELPVYYEVVKPSLELAIESVQIKYPHLSFKLRALKDVNNCKNNMLGPMLAEEYYLRKVSVLIGPICTKGLDIVGRLASYWGIPLITAGGVGIEFSDKSIFKSLTRISFSLDRVADFFTKILQDYDWHHLSFIIDENDPKSAMTRSSILAKLKSLRDYEIFVDTQEFAYQNDDNSTKYDKLLLQAKKAARVFFFIMNGELTRNFLIHAYDLGMGNGEYVFFGIELVRSIGSTNDFSWYKAGDKNNKKARAIYESFFSLAVRVPISAEYSVFVNKVFKKAMSEFESINDTNVNPLYAAIYDAVSIYTWAYNKTLSVKNGTNYRTILNLLWNNIFQNGLSGDIVINKNGDREVDYTLSDFNPETGTMQSVLTYYGKRMTVERNTGANIHWPSNLGPPLDIPYCGFNDDAKHCIETEKFPIWAILLAAIMLTLIGSVIVLYFILKKVRSEQDLNSTWWNIDYNEIEFLQTSKSGTKSAMSLISNDETNKSGVNSSMRAATQMSAACSLISTAGKLDSVFIATYRGLKTAYKPLNVKKLTFSRKMLQEFRMMRDVKHENLVRFIGICLDEQNTGILTELMIRGSLRNILDNEKMQIDWMFRYSMISDIIEAMIFLHNSEIEFHGRLKSSNCVVDGRFMVKLTDYGLNLLHKQIVKEQDINLRAYFWTAPEHMRTEEPLACGSKKGDIYSFAIVVQEIITRAYPFEFNLKKDKRSFEPNEIIDRIKMGLNPPFRPETQSEDCPPKLMRVVEACWDESPDARPEFIKIKAAMRKISQGMSSSNFIDNLLKRMEAYSKNLEDLVEEKTQTIVEEKMKTEELLYQLLPRYIANELKSGRYVKPETFDSVTIFFSDIVGFTTLSAQSNPMQVVDLLNDLYTSFDALINTFDAYKIETIGDAYMVASGVPIRNGNEHAKEISLMSLKLRVLVDKFKIRHLPTTKLRLRIGIHSGPCAAGVVGTKMPKYLLFGDTVNTASRMESQGEPLKIHISHATKKLLDLFQYFVVTERGEIEIKGKGKMRTYWLESFNEPKA